MNSHESIILINNRLLLDEIDSFFNLEKGTFNPTEHQIVFSLFKRDGYSLEYYINLPVKNNNGQLGSTEFECNIKYESVRPYRFYDYQVKNRNIVVRVIEKNTNVIRQLNSNQIIAQKYFPGVYQFGKINIFNVNKSGITRHCN